MSQASCILAGFGDGVLMDSDVTLENRESPQCWGQRQMLAASLHVSFQHPLWLCICKGVMLGRGIRPL